MKFYKYFFIFFLGILLSFKADNSEFKYKMAILIDDVGSDTYALNKFFLSNLKINFAVLPFMPQTKESIKIILEKRYNYLLHLPLEAKYDTLLNENTKGLIKTKNSYFTISAMFQKALEETNFPSGFNNHMGSKFTSDTVKMIELLQVAKNYGMYFIDSNTYLKSQKIKNETPFSFRLAKLMNVPSFYNSKFIDFSENQQEVQDAIKKAVEMCREKQKILIIGHNKDITANALYNLRKIFSENNIELIETQNLLD